MSMVSSDPELPCPSPENLGTMEHAALIRGTIPTAENDLSPQDMGNSHKHANSKTVQSILQFESKPKSQLPLASGEAVLHWLHHTSLRGERRDRDHAQRWRPRTHSPELFAVGPIDRGSLDAGLSRRCRFTLAFDRGGELLAVSVGSALQIVSYDRVLHLRTQHRNALVSQVHLAPDPFSHPSNTFSHPSPDRDSRLYPGSAAPHDIPLHSLETVASVPGTERVRVEMAVWNPRCKNQLVISYATGSRGLQVADLTRPEFTFMNRPCFGCPSNTSPITLRIACDDVAPLVYGSGDDGSVRVWDMRRPRKPVKSIPQRGFYHSLSPVVSLHTLEDGGGLVCGDQSGNITVWDMRFAPLPVNTISLTSQSQRVWPAVLVRDPAILDMSPCRGCPSSLFALQCHTVHRISLLSGTSVAFPVPSPGVPSSDSLAGRPLITIGTAANTVFATDEVGGRLGLVGAHPPCANHRSRSVTWNLPPREERLAMVLHEQTGDVVIRGLNQLEIWSLT